MSLLLHRAGLTKGAPYAPASMVFNGSDEVLTRKNATSSPTASTAKFTFSVWMSTVNAGGVFLTSYSDDFFDATQILFTSGGQFVARVFVDNVAGIQEFADTGTVIVDGTWHHYLCRYDNTQASAPDRIRFYVDGVFQANFLTDTGSEPSLGEAHSMFADGFGLDLGNLSVGSFAEKTLAFVDILDGVSEPPESFAFDNGGTWTRKPYVGSYGKYGFKLDGTDTFNDASGNHQNFTGTNMDASNLDTGDLPPYIN